MAPTLGGGVRYAFHKDEDDGTTTTRCRCWTLRSATRFEMPSPCTISATQGDGKPTSLGMGIRGPPVMDGGRFRIGIISAVLPEPASSSAGLHGRVLRALA